MWRRRTLLQCWSILPAGWALPAAAGAQAAPLPRAVFDVHGTAAALRACGAGPLAASDDVGLQVQELVEDGATVEVAISTRVAGAERLLLLVEKNPFALAAAFELGDAIEPRFTLRIKIAESSNVQVVALMPDRRAYFARKAVAVTIGGCGDVDGAPSADRPPAAGPRPTRMRTQAAGGQVVVRSLMSHEMESGQRKDGAGRLVPAWHITDVTASVNGRAALHAQWGAAVSRNPYLQFVLRQARAGDRLAIGWVDNRGERRDDEVVIA